MVSRIVTACLVSGALCGCLEVAEERARLDARVGHARHADVAVDVAGGMAAIRELQVGRLQLWATAPELEVALSTGADATEWEIQVDNAMPDAVLSARVEGEPVDAMLTDAPHPTVRRFVLSLPAHAEATLALSVADAQDGSPFRYAVFADVQEAIDQVQDIYTRMNDDPAIRFVVMSGDLTQRGTRPELRRFQRELVELRVPCFSTLGNHELGDDEGNYHRYYGRGSYHFSFHGAHFTLLDDASATLAPRVYGWLDGWLDDGADGFHAVHMHIPPLDARGIRNGAFASRAEANMLLGRLSRAGVDLTVYGHVHSYYAYQNAGMQAFITGGGGAIPERLDRIGRHYVVVDVDPRSQRFDAAMVRVD